MNIHDFTNSYDDDDDDTIEVVDPSAAPTAFKSYYVMGQERAENLVRGTHMFDEEILRITKSGPVWLKAAVARNPKLSAETVDLLCHDVAFVAIVAIGHPNLTKSTLRSLAAGKGSKNMVRIASFILNGRNQADNANRLARVA